MTTKERKKLETLRNYMEKAIWKSMEIESGDWRVKKVNAELTELIALLDEVIND